MSTGINIASSSGITVGTTAVTSGTNGRVFFQAGGVVQQDGNFTYDNTLKRLGLKAVNTGAGDIPFQIQNSAGTANLMQVAGDNTMTFLSSDGKIIFSQNTIDSGSVISLRRNFTNQEIIRLNGTNNGGITINPLNDGSTKSVAIGSVANGISMWTTGTNSHNFQIKDSFHNVFHVVGNPNSATATFRLGTIASNTNFFNIHGRNAGGTGLTTNPIFTINSSGTVGIGTEASTPGARLDVRAQGALSTDIAFRVRNSADTANLVTVQGNGNILFNNTTHGLLFNSQTLGSNQLELYSYGATSVIINPLVSRFAFTGLSGAKGVVIGNSSTAPVALLDVWDFAGPGPGTTVARFGSQYNNTGADNLNILFSTRYSGFTAGSAHLGRLNVGQTGSGASTNARSYFKFELIRNNTLAERASITSQSNLLLQTPTEDTNDIGVIYIPNGTAPTGSITDGYKQYSADITAGNAAPHFRTENGAIVKVYQETTAVTAAAFVANTSAIVDDTATFGGYTIGQVVAALKAQGLLA
jgi:hypothetical protein